MATYRDEYYEGRKGGFLGKFVALLLGFLLGIISTIGGIAGFGYYIVAKIKIRKAADYLNSFGLNFNVENFVGEDYVDGTVLNMVKGLTSLGEEYQAGTLTLSSLEPFSPYVRTLADTLVQAMNNYGVDTTTDEVMTITLNKNGLTDFAKGKADQIELGAVMDAVGVEKSPLILSVCYGEEGVDYTVGEDGKITMNKGSKATTVGDLLNKQFDTILDRVSVASIMSLAGDVNTKDSITRALLYGQEDETYTVGKDGKIEMLPLAYEITETSVTDPDGTVYTYKSQTGKYETDKPEDGYVTVAPAAAPAAMSTAISETYAFYDKDGALIYTLKQSETAGVFNAYKNDVLQKHRPLSVGTLMEGDFESLISRFYLSDLLGVTAKSDGVVLSLCYGTEGEDYRIVGTGDNAKIEVLNKSAKTSVADLMGDNSADLFNSLELGAILNVDPTDNTMAALAYGKKGTQYETYKDGETTKIRMLPIEYVEKNGEWFNEDGEKIAAPTEQENGRYVITRGETTVYAELKEDSTNVYYIYETATSEAPILYTRKTVGDLRGGSDSLFNDLELGVLIGANGKSDGVILALCYGSEGEDYEIDANNEIVMKNGAKPTTVADLMGDKSTDLFNSLELGAILNVSPTDNTMAALAYGKKGTQYETYKDGETTKIRMLPIVYTENGGEWFNEDGEKITAPTEQENGRYVITRGTETVYAQAASTGAGTYYIYSTPTSTEAIRYQKKTVADLRGGSDSLFNDLELGVLVNANGKSDKVILSLCYGTEGEDYEINAANEIVMKNGAKPTTVADLMGDNSTEIFNALELGAILNVDPTDNTMAALAYGKKGTQYETYKDGETTKIRMLPIEYVEKNGEWFNEDGEKIATPTKDGDRYAIKRGETTVYAELKEDSTNVYYIYETVTSEEPILYSKKTVGDLRGGSDELFNDLELGILVNANGKSDKVILSLCYGTEGEDYIINANNEIVMKNGAKPTTVADLMGDNATEIFNALELGSILNVDPTDDTMCAISYGKKGTQYETYKDGETTKIRMLPIEYTVENGEWFNEDGEKIATPTKDGDRYAIVRGETTVYAEAKEDGSNIYYLYETATSEEPILYSKKTLGDLRGGSDALLNDLELGVLINANGKSDKVILSLCYGTEGEDYIINSDNEIVMINGSKPKTVADLTGDNATEIFNALEIGAILNVDPTDDTMCAIAYGRKDVQYEVYEDTDGTKKIRMLPVVYTLKADELYDDYNKKLAASDYTLDATSGVYTITLKDGDTTKTVYAKATDQESALAGETKYYLYEKADLSAESQIYHQKKTLGDLRGGSDQLMNDMEIAVLLNVDHKSEPLKIALAYGKEGEDFVFEYDAVTGEKTGIRPIHPPKTVASLQEEGTFDDIRLDAVMDVDLDNKVTMYVLYGAEGMHYELDASNNVKMLGMRIAVYVDPVTGEAKAWDEQGEELGPENFYVSNGVYYHEYLHDKFQLDVSETGKYKDTSGNYTFYTWEQTDDEGQVVGTVQVPYYVGYYINKDGEVMDHPYVYSARTIGDLSGEHCPIGTVTQELRIGEIFGGETTSPLMNAIADWKIADLDNQENIEGLKLGDVLGGSGSSKILQAITDKGWTIADLKDQKNIESLTLADVIEIDDSSSGILKAIRDKNWTIADLKDQEKIESLTLADVITIDDSSSGILKAIKNKGWTIKDLQDQENIESLEIAELLTIDNTSSGILKAIKKNDWSIADLQKQENIEGLKLAEIITIDDSSSGILKAIKKNDWSIADLQKQENIEGLKLADILTIDESSSGILKTMADKGWTIAHLQKQENIEGLTLAEIITIDDSSSGILKAIKAKGWTIADLQKQENIEGLTLSEIITIDDSSSGILKAIKAKGWTIADLQKQENIEGLTLADIITINDSSSGILKAIKKNGWTIKDLQDQDKIESLEIADIIPIDENSSGILKAMADKHWTIAHLNDQTNIESLEIGEIITIGNNASGILKAMADNHWTIADLKDQSKINSLELGAILPQSNDTPKFLKTLIDKGYTIGQLNSPDTMNNLTLGDVVEIKDTDAHFLRELADVPLSELTQEINEMELSKVLETSSQNDRILKHLQHSTLKTLTEDLAALTVQVVYEDLVYRSVSAGNTYLTYASYADYQAGITTTMTVAADSYAILNKDGIRIILDERETAENATKHTHEKYYIENSDNPATEAFDPEYSSPVLVGTWKYLLTHENESIDENTGVITYTYDEEDVPVENMAQMINNIQVNVKHAPLYDFDADMELGLDKGFLDTNLSSQIIDLGVSYYTINNTTAENKRKLILFNDMKKIYETEADGAQIGDISIEELAAYIFVLMNVTSFTSAIGT